MMSRADRARLQAIEEKHQAIEARQPKRGARVRWSVRNRANSRPREGTVESYGTMNGVPFVGIWDDGRKHFYRIALDAFDTDTAFHVAEVIG